MGVSVKDDKQQVIRLLRALRKRAVRERNRLARQATALHKVDQKKASDKVNVDEWELVASICRESFFDFVKEFWDVVSQEKPVWNWHIEYLCGEIQTMMERLFLGLPREYDLVVNIPPGTTKSTLMSVMLPAWAWTRMPRFKMIGASYSEKLARDDLSMKTRDIVTSDKYMKCFPEIVLREDQNTKGYFQNTKGGWRYAVGVRGTVTGKHAHCIAIDDPLNPEEAFSEADLKSANRWIKETLSNRKQNKATAITILVMQRLHEDDPTAQFLLRKRIKHIRLPADLEDDPLPIEIRQFYKKGLLDPVRLSKDVLDEARDFGEGYYASQFRQMPAPPSGAMFKTGRLKTGIPPDSFDKVVRFWDKAGTAAGGNWTVGTLMAIDFEGRFWVLDVQRFQQDSFEREATIEKVARRDGYHVHIGVEQEPGSGGKESAENTVRRLAGFKVKVVKVDKATGSKQERADPWSVQVNAGNVYLPAEMRIGNVWQSDSWAQTWVDEHKMFPHSKYKDQVDSASLAFSMCHTPRIRIGGIDPGGIVS